MVNIGDITPPCGVDVGLKNFAIPFRRNNYQNPKFFRTLEKKVANAQYIFSRRKELAIKQRSHFMRQKTIKNKI